MEAYDSVEATQDIEIFFWRADLFNGYYTFYYVIPKAHDSNAQITVEVLSTEALTDARLTVPGDTNYSIPWTELQNYYQHIQGSPFAVASKSTATPLIGTYQDILRGGWAITDNSFMRNLEAATYFEASNHTVNETFRLTIFPKDTFNISFV